jgi:RNA polymerase sigma factor (sigma-70 family)
MLDGELESLFRDMDSRNLPDAALESQELRDLVGTTMGSIPEAYGKLLEMKYISGLSVRDIASSLRKTEKAVESQLTRARVAFREAFTVLATDMPAF